MKSHIWYYEIIAAIQSDDLELVFSLHGSFRYYRVSRLNIATNSVLKYGDMSETTKFLELCWMNPTVSYSNPQYLGFEYFEYTGMSRFNILRINWLIVKF